MKLSGLVGSHLFGFMATIGLLRLLDSGSRRSGTCTPRLAFDDDYSAVITGLPTADAIVACATAELELFRQRLTSDFAPIERPADLSHRLMAQIGSSRDDLTLDELAGLGCNIGEEAWESTLCAANGAGHQNLVISMRDVVTLCLRSPRALHAAIEAPWRVDYEVSSADRKACGLGSRKPTLRLDPSDERLYALRANDPTSKDAYFRTEIGAQALAAAAFGALPVVPGMFPVTVASARDGHRVYFYWGLWSPPATYTTVRSLLATGARRMEADRSRGVFASFRAARITGDKGKLSIAPTEPCWS